MRRMNGAWKWIVVMGVAACFCAAAACDRERDEPVEQRSHYHSRQANAQIHLQLLKPEGQERLRYSVERTITRRSTVDDVMDILQQINWENAKVDMSRPPDYKLETIIARSSDLYEPATYAIWLAPRKDRLEIVVEGKSQYAMLSSRDSRALMKLLRIGDAEGQDNELFDRGQ